MSSNNELHLHEPYEVGDYIVLLTSENSGNIVEMDCRRELNATTTGCQCCSYLVYSQDDPDYKCKHMKALLELLDSGTVVS